MVMAIGNVSLDVSTCIYSYPTDVITIDKTGENFRLMFDVKGRFTVHRISNEEAKARLCTVCI